MNFSFHVQEELLRNICYIIHFHIAIKKLVRRSWWVKKQKSVIVWQCTRSSIEIQLPSRVIVGSPATKLPDISTKKKEGEGPCRVLRNSWYGRQVRLTQTRFEMFFICPPRCLSMTQVCRSETRGQCESGRTPGRRLRSFRASSAGAADFVGIVTSFTSLFLFFKNLKFQI